MWNSVRWVARSRVDSSTHVMRAGVDQRRQRRTELAGEGVPHPEAHPAALFHLVEQLGPAEVGELVEVGEEVGVDVRLLDLLD